MFILLVNNKLNLFLKIYVFYIDISDLLNFSFFSLVQITHYFFYLVGVSIVHSHLQKKKIAVGTAKVCGEVALQHHFTYSCK